MDVDLGVVVDALDVVDVLVALVVEKPVHLAVGLVLAVALIAQQIVIADAQVAIAVLLSVKEDVAVVVLAVQDAAEAADLLVDMDVLLIVAVDAEPFAHPVVEHAKDVEDVLGALMRVQGVALVDAQEIATEVALVDVEPLVVEPVMELARKVVMDAQIVVAVIVQKVALDVLDVEALALLVVLGVQDVAEDVADVLVLVLILVLQLAHQLVLTHVRVHVMVLLLQPVAN